MRISSMGQVTIPQDIREQYGLLPCPTQQCGSWWKKDAE